MISFNSPSFTRISTTSTSYSPNDEFVDETEEEIKALFGVAVVATSSVSKHESASDGAVLHSKQSITQKNM